MAIDTLRSTEILTSADALLPNQSDMSTIPAASGVAAGVASLPSDLGLTAAGDDANPVESVANDAVLDLHAQLEATADSNGLIGAVHGLTNLGETVGLGHLGGVNLLSSVLAAPTALTSGDTTALGQIAPEGTAIEGAATQLVRGAASDVGINPDATTPVTDLTGEASALTGTPLVGLANDTIDSLHTTLEAGADANGLIGSVHGLTNLGETVGLGKIGDANLVTDVVDTPSAMLAGDTSTLTHLPTDVANIATAAQGLVSGVTSDLSNGTLLADPVGNATGFVTSLASLPVEGIANDAINSVHATLEAGIDPLAPDTIHGITSLGHTVGLGELGGSNLLTDTLSAPGALLSGDTTPLSNLPSDLGSIGTAVAALPGDVAKDLDSSSLVGTLTHPTTGGGALAGDLPGSGVVDTVTSTATGLVNGATNAAGLGNVSQPVTSALDTAQSGLIHDVTQIPGDVVAGATTGLPSVVSDVGGTLTSVGSTVATGAGDVTHALGATDAGGAVAPLVDTVAGVTAPLTNGLATGAGSSAIDTAAQAVDGAISGITAPLASSTGGLASTVSGLVGSSTGTSGHDLATVSLGSQTPTSGTNLDVLSNETGTTHLVDSHVGSASAPTPILANITILPDSIHVPAATGGGLDSLSGVVSAVTSTAAPDTGAATSAAHGLDFGIAHVDVPVAAHAEPLHGLAHAV